MNKRKLKLTTLTTLALALGTVGLLNTAEADPTTNTGGVKIEQVAPASNNQQAVSNVAVSNTAATQAASYSQSVTAAQQINFPNNYRLADLQNVNDQTTANEFNKTALPGLTSNNYQQNSVAAAESVDISQLTDQQVNEMNQYTLNLVNNARAAFGESVYSQNAATINAVRRMAQQYQNKNESLLNGHWHDESILQNDSENISAMQVYADNQPGIVVRHFDTATGNDFIDENSIPLFAVTNMDDLRAMIFYGVTTMLFDDASDTYGHAQNFLTNYQPISTMAIYPSILNGYGIGTTLDNTNFQYRLKDVDMHFIWASGTEEPTESTTPAINVDDNWKTINGKLYRLAGDKFLTGWQSINACWYYFNADGAAQTGWFRSAAGNWYYFNPTTAQAETNWQKINGHWYYFDDDNAWALKGWLKTAVGNWYYFDLTNAWALTGWYHSGAGNWFYFDPTNAWALKDWQRINGRWYYFDPANAWALKGWFKTAAGNWYYFDPTNAWAETSWQRINGRWYYFNSNNAWALKGWFQTVTGAWYYFDPVNAWAETGWQWINGCWYYFDGNGKMQTGTVWINGRTYCFDNGGHWLGY